MEGATRTARRRVGYTPCLQKLPVICLLWAWFTSGPSSGPQLSFSPCALVHHCHILPGSFVWAGIRSLNSDNVFPMGSLIWAAVCLQVEPGHSLPQTPSAMPGEIDCVIMQSNENSSAYQWLCFSVSCVTKSLSIKTWEANDTMFSSGVSCHLTDICVTGSEDKRRRRKGGSHFSEARKRGRTMLYQLTSQFSRGGKREVKLSGVSTFTTSRTLPGRPCALSAPSERNKPSGATQTCGRPQSRVWIINVDI